MDWLSGVGVVVSIIASMVGMVTGVTSLWITLRKERARELAERSKAQALKIRIVASDLSDESRRGEPGYTFAALNGSMHPINIVAIAGVVRSAEGANVYENVYVGEIRIARAVPDLGLAP